MEILGSEARLDCFRPEPSLKELMRQRTPESIRWRMRHGYPQNHMRNLARKACQVCTPSGTALSGCVLLGSPTTSFRQHANLIQSVSTL